MVLACIVSVIFGFCMRACLVLGETHDDREAGAVHAYEYFSWIAVEHARSLWKKTKGQQQPPPPNCHDARWATEFNSPSTSSLAPYALVSIWTSISIC